MGKLTDARVDAAIAAAEPKRPSAAGPADFAEFSVSSIDTMFDGALVIHGPPGVGKTWFAGTASEFWPELVPSAKRIELLDMLWFQVDAGATAGFAEQNIVLPKGHVIDVRGAIAQHGLLKGLNGTMDLLDQQCQKLRPKYVVADTISMLDKFMVDYYEARCPMMDNGEPVPFWTFKQILMLHRRFYSRIMMAGAQVIFLCHSKVQAEIKGSNDFAKNASLGREARSVPGGFDIIPEISGQARNLYVGNSNIEGVLKARIMPGPGKQLMRFFYPQGSTNHEGKSRFTRSLKREEGPNPSLRAIYDKIRAAAKGDESVCTPDLTTNIHDDSPGT